MTNTTTKTRTPVFFVAVRLKGEPMTVNFYTMKGKKVDYDAVKKIKTKKEGVHFYIETEVKKH